MTMRPVEVAFALNRNGAPANERARRKFPLTAGLAIENVIHRMPRLCGGANQKLAIIAQLLE